MGVQENVSERNKLMWEVLNTLHMRRTDRLMSDKVREMLVEGRMAVVYVGMDGVVIVDNGKEEVRGVKEYMGKTATLFCAMSRGTNLKVEWKVVE